MSDFRSMLVRADDVDAGSDTAVSTMGKARVLA